MKRASVLAVLLMLGMATVGKVTPVYADAQLGGVDATTQAPHDTRVVFNDSGSEIVSGEIVIWDSGDTEFDRSGYPYVLTTTSVDSPWVAGVVDAGQRCPDQSLCVIVTYGPVIAKVADATDALVDNTLVSSSSVDGQVGDYTAAANTCALGRAMELRDVDNLADTGRDGSRMWVFVDIDCQ